MGSVTATNVGLFDLSTPLSNGASAASSPASEKASQAVQGFDIIEISARALELQAAGFDLSTALPNSTSAQLPAGTSSAIDKAPQQAPGFDILVLCPGARSSCPYDRDSGDRYRLNRHQPSAVSSICLVDP